MRSWRGMLEIEPVFDCAPDAEAVRHPCEGTASSSLLDASVLQVTAGAASRAKRKLPLLFVRTVVAQPIL
jgi:hypothetical protein